MTVLLLIMTAAPAWAATTGMDWSSGTVNVSYGTGATQEGSWQENVLTVDDEWVYCADVNTLFEVGKQVSREDPVNTGRWSQEMVTELALASDFIWSGKCKSSSIYGDGHVVTDNLEKYALTQVYVWSILNAHGYSDHGWFGSPGLTDEYVDKQVYDYIDEWKDTWVGHCNYYDAGTSQSVVCGFWIEPVPQTSGYGDLVISKSAACEDVAQGNTLYSLKGAKFELQDGDGNVVKTKDGKSATATTNAEGEATIKGIEAGKYKLVETKAPKGYKLAKAKNVRVKAGQTTEGGNPNTVEVVEQNIVDPQGINVQKVTDADEHPSLAGAQFTFRFYAGGYYTKGDLPSKPTREWVMKTNGDGWTNANAEKLKVSGDDFYRDENGKGVVIPLGTYTVTETKAPKGFEIGTTETYIAWVEANDDGTASFTWKTKAVEQDKLSQNTLEKFEPTVKKPGRLIVGKYDAETGEWTPQGDASFKGAEFTVYDADGNEVASATTKWNSAYDGYVANTGKCLDLGTYTVRETKAPEGYQLDESWSRTVKIDESGETVEFVSKKNAEPETPEKGSVVVAKCDKVTGKFTPQGGGSFAGAQFTLYNASKNPVKYDDRMVGVGEEVCTIATAWDDAYNAYVAKTPDSSLPYGTYTVKETRAPKGYQLDESWSATAEVHANGVPVAFVTKKTAEKETPIKGGIVVAKCDKDANAVQGNAQLKGAEFEVVNTSANPVRVGGKECAPGSVVKTIKAAWSDDYGAYVAKTGARELPFGTYLVRESKPPTGYKLNSGWAREVSVVNDGELHGYVSGDAKFLADEEVMRGHLKVVKSDSTRAGGKAQGDATLAGAKYDIVNDSENPVLSPVDGKTSVAKGEVVCTIVTNAAGIATTANAAVNGWAVPKGWSGALAYGRYIVREQNGGAPEGYYVDEDWKAEFDVSADGETQEAAHAESVKRGGVSVTKFDRHSQKPYPQGDADFAGTTFNVVNASDAPVEVGGVEYGVGKVVCSIEASWDESAQAYVAATPADLLPYGTYKVKETTSGNGYQFDAQSKAWESKPLQVRKENKHVRCSVYGEAADNDVKRGNVELTKVDREVGHAQGNATLAGAQYHVINRSKGSVLSPEDGKTEIAPGGVVCTIVTDESGVASTTNAAANGWSIPSDWGGKALAFGTYDVVEANPSNGYRLNTEWKGTDGIDQDGKLSVHYTDEDVIRGGLMVVKYDRDSKASAEQGDAKLAGAKFTVTNISKNPVKVGDKEYPKDSVVCTIEAKWDASRGAYVASTAEDVSATEDRTLPYGRYRVKEVASPEGYLLDDASQAWQQDIDVTADGKIEERNVYGEAPDNRVERGNIELQKTDWQRASGREQGNAKLAGAVYDIVNRSAASVLSPQYGTMVEPGGVVCKIVTDAEGKASTTRSDLNGWAIPDDWDGKALPYGTYDVVEESPSTGYNLNASWKGDAVIRQDGQVAGLATDEDVQRGMLKVGKVSRENGKYHEQGAASLEMWAFEVVNKSAEPVIAGRDGTTEVAPGDVVCTIQTVKTEDGKFIAATAADALPFGHYEVHEIQTMRPQDNGYLFDEQSKAWSREFDITREGDVVDFTAEEDAEANQVVRGDLSLGKKSAPKMKPLAGVPFKVTSVTTGEWHLVVTDENGEIDTSAANYKHTSKTNGNDKALKADGTVNESKLDYEAGVWFSGSTTQPVPADDSRGALVFDTYRIEELRVEANKDFELVDFEVTVTRDGKRVDLGTIDDSKPVKPLIATTLTDGQGGKIVPADAEAVVVDKVKYNNLEPGKAYKLEAKLYTLADGATADLVGENATEFKPSLAHGEHDVEIKLDASKLGSRQVVCFEKLYDASGKQVASHEDAADEGQIVSIPQIATELADNATGTHFAAAETEGTIVLTDTVRFSSLTPNKTYKVRGTLHDKQSGEAVTDAAGNAVTAERDFTPREPEGQVELSFSFKDPGLAGKAVVAFEALEYRGVTYAVHADLNDESQTVYIPKVSTSFVEKGSASHYTSAMGVLDLVDTVAYENLAPGATYKLRASLVNKATGQPVTDAEGNAVGSEVEFSPAESAGSIEVPFKVDTAWLPEATVCFERLYATDTALAAAHEDLQDEGQTLYVPGIATTLADKATGSHYTSAMGDIELVDTVTYDNLEPGKAYTMNAKLADKATGETLKSASGEDYEVQVAFTPEQPSGTVEVPFKVSAADIAPAAVCFEKLYTAEGSLVAAHENPDDEDQTVRVPALSTTAVDARTGSHVAAHGTLQLVDDVDYENLQPGAEYLLEGAVHVRAANGSDAGPLQDAQGNDIVASATLVPESPEGTATLAFKANAEVSPGTTLVVFETLRNIQAGTIAAEHADIADEGQSVALPSIATTAVDKASGSHYAAASGTLAITDTVAFENLVPGVEYKLHGEVHAVDENGSDAGVVLDAEGNSVVAEKTFVPKEASGAETVEFEAAVPNPPAKAVVFERLSIAAGEGDEARDITVADHADATDEGQSVSYARIGTTARDQRTGGKAMPASALADGALAIEDEVTYEGLEPGAEYTLEGTVHVRAADGSDAGPLKDSAGNDVTAKATFTPEASSGIATMVFQVKADVAPGTTLVVFESLVNAEGAIVAEHADISDESQSVHAPVLGTTATELASGTHYAGAMEPVDIVDEVAYENLVPGQPYVMRGELHGLNEDGSDAGVLTDASGAEVTVSREFTPDEANGALQIVFELEPGHLPAAAVAFERLYAVSMAEGEGEPDAPDQGASPEQLVAEHADIADEGQTVNIAQIETTLADAATGSHVLSHAGAVALVDTVAYRGLQPGYPYVLEASLVDKSTGKVLRDGESAPLASTLEFVPEQASGSAHVRFEVDSAHLAGATVCFERLLMADGTIVAVHEDLDDEGQTVRVPVIGTSAVDKKTGSHVGALASGLHLVDTVTYANLMAGNTYHLAGSVHVRAADGSDAGVLKDAAGREVTAQATFKAKDSFGSVDMQFEADAPIEPGTTLVVFEELADAEGLPVAEHADISDDAQSVRYPSLSTTAVEKASEGHYATALEPFEVVDTVAYENLEPGLEYELHGELHGLGPHGEDAGVVKDNDGHDAMTSVKFTPETPSGEVEVTFSVDPSDIETGVVAFERVSVVVPQGTVAVAEHADITDEGQTVRIARIATELCEAATGEHIVARFGEVELVDTVTYQGLQPGQPYVLEALLVDKQTGKTLHDADGNELGGSLQFTPSGASGSAEVPMKVDASRLTGATVCFERLLTPTNALVASHEDLEDANQTVYAPALATTALDPRTRSHAAALSDELRIIDTVRYSDLLPGTRYQVTGTVHVRAADGSDAGPLKDQAGQDVTASTEFTPSEPTGTVDLELKAQVPVEPGTTLVVFEELALCDSGMPVARHDDINDDEQSVRVPRVSTVATEKRSGSHYASSLEPVSIVDAVMYANLVPGAEYELVGEVHGIAADGSDMGVLRDASGAKAVTRVVFTPDAPAGSVQVDLEVDPGHAPSRTVVFEQLCMNVGGHPVPVARHADIDDADQTVSIASVSTSAHDKASGGHRGAAGETATVVDRVSYEGLQPGAEYTLSGRLMNKDTGEALVMGGREVSTAVTFKPEAPSGSVEVEFGLTDPVPDGLGVVVFEQLVDSADTVVATHEDLSSKDQSVRYGTPPVPEVVTEVFDKAGYWLARFWWVAFAAGVALVAVGARHRGLAKSGHPRRGDER